MTLGVIPFEKLLLIVVLLLVTGSDWCLLVFSGREDKQGDFLGFIQSERTEHRAWLLHCVQLTHPHTHTLSHSVSLSNTHTYTRSQSLNESSWVQVRLQLHHKTITSTHLSSGASSSSVKIRCNFIKNYPRSIINLKLTSKGKKHPIIPRLETDCRSRSHWPVNCW